MRVTAFLSERALRFVDDARGDYPMTYSVHVVTDVTATSEEYLWGDVEVLATDEDGDMEEWHWNDLSSREQADAECQIIAEFERQQAEAARRAS